MTLSKECIVCGTEFKPTTTQITCSPECRAVRKKEYLRQWNADNYPARYLRQKHRRKVDQYKNPEVKMWRVAKYRAKSLNLSFNIEPSDIVIPDVCPIFKLPLERYSKMAPSLDKIIPALGYVKGNIQVISKKANLMKQDATPEELKMFAEWIMNA